MDGSAGSSLDYFTMTRALLHYKNNFPLKGQTDGRTEIATYLAPVGAKNDVSVTSCLLLTSKQLMSSMNENRCLYSCC